MNTSHYQILNRVFSKKVLLDLINNGTNDLYRNSVTRLLNKEMISASNNGSVIKTLYTLIEKYYRNEYFYKNTILNKILLGRHSINTTVALNEVPIEKSIADFILINGKATVYEIKSEIDNVNRLGNQLENYYKAFTTVYVVTHQKNEQKVLDEIQNENVGIIILNNRNQLSIRKQAKPDSSKLSNETILKVLRKQEYENILLKFFHDLPSVNTIMYYRECLKWVNSIDTEEFYSNAIQELHKRNITFGEEYQKFVPYELKFPIYFSNLRENDYKQLDDFLYADFGG